MFKLKSPNLPGWRTFEIWFLKFLLRFELCVLTVGSLHAAPPTLDHFYPVAAQVGTTSVVTAIGKFNPWPPRIWADAPGIVFQAETNKGKFVVTVASDAPVGPHLVRAFNAEGASRPRFFVITREDQTAEKEPNDEFSAPQEIAKLPATINGRLDKVGDVDSFAVTLTSGQTLIASVDAYVLASPLDALLRVTDSRGVQLAWNHDGGRALDPFLAFTACASGRHVVQVMGFPYPATSNVRFHGGEACVYRLHLSGDAFLGHTLPLGVQRGAKTRLHLVGWNDADRAARDFPFDGTMLTGNCPTATLRVPGFQNTLELPAGDGVERVEIEPNNTSAQANPMGVPGAVTGGIDTVGDEDRFAFTVEKGDQVRFEILSASLGFPLDSWLKIEDANGKELARNDDSDGPDPKLDWAAPASGTFIAVVGSLLHRGGSNLLYRLAAGRLKPDFSANLSEHAVVIRPGGTNDIKVAVARLSGFKEALTVRAAGLPNGLSLAPVDAPEKSGEVVLKLVAATNASPTNVAFQIRVGNDSLEHSAKFQLTASTQDNGVPGGFRELVIPETDQVWLTVPAAPPDPSTNAPETKP